MMPKRTKFKVEGLRELEKALIELPKATAKSVVRRGLMDAAGSFVTSIAARAPRFSGRLSASAGAGTKLSKRQRSLHKKESAVEVYAGFGSLPQAITEEFGTANQAPRPTVTPEWEAQKRPMLDSIKDFLAERIEQAAKRLAKKRARG